MSSQSCVRRSKKQVTCTCTLQLIPLILTTPSISIYPASKKIPTCTTPSMVPAEEKEVSRRNKRYRSSKLLSS